MDFAAMAELCAPEIHIDTLHRIVSVESSYNPYAIGVVGGRLERQPSSLAEATNTAHELEHLGYNYSVGLTQINRSNFARYGLTLLTAFDPCRNLGAGARILADCYQRAIPSPSALTDAFSCYYSGSFTAGYGLGYVAKIQTAKVLSLTALPDRIPIVPMMSERDRQARSSIRLAVAKRPVPLRVPVPDALFVSASATSASAGAQPVASAPSPAQTGPATALLF